MFSAPERGGASGASKGWRTRVQADAHVQRLITAPAPDAWALCEFTVLKIEEPPAAAVKNKHGLRKVTTQISVLRKQSGFFFFFGNEIKPNQNFILGIKDPSMPLIHTFTAGYIVIRRAPLKTFRAGCEFRVGVGWGVSSPHPGENST